MTAARGWRSMNEQQLIALFRVLRARDPKARARSQIKRGVAELPRDLFLSFALRRVIRPHKRDWLSGRHPNRPDVPGGAFQPAIDRLLTAGAPVRALATIVSLMQMWLVVGLCELLDDPGELEPEVSDIRWRLFLCDEDGAPEAPIMRMAAILLAGGSTEAGGHSVEHSEAKPPPHTAGRWRSMNEQELTELFRKLGADEPEAWAHSQITQGIPQLLRYLFLRQAWRKVIGHDDRDWLTAMFRDEPEGEDDFAQAIDAVLATGAPPEDLTTVVRIAQWEVLFGFCTLLDDTLVFRVKGRFVPLRKLTGFRWQLFLIDENDIPVVPIDGLHESVLETDPTGLEMCPPQTRG